MNLTQITIISTTVGKNPLEELVLKLNLQYFGHLMQTAESFEKTLMLGRLKAGGEGDMTEDEMVKWHH